MVVDNTIVSDLTGERSQLDSAGKVSGLDDKGCTAFGEGFRLPERLDVIQNGVPAPGGRRRSDH